MALSAQRPKAVAIQLLERLDRALGREDVPAVMEMVILPPSMVSLTPSEQQRQIREALRGELTSAGIKALAQEGKFGRAVDLFPEDIDHWAGIFCVNPTNCMAWRMGDGLLRSEVVLFPERPPFRLLRCNNVFLAKGATGRQE